MRPVEPEQIPAIYAANNEAFRTSQHGYEEDSYEDFLHDLGWPQSDLDLWVVAWDSEQIAGLVINEIDADGEGHTPWVAVNQAWRRKGLGKALMTRSLQRLQERGVRRAKLSTIEENPGKSVHLYERVGYRVVKRQPRYRKAM